MLPAQYIALIPLQDAAIRALEFAHHHREAGMLHLAGTPEDLWSAAVAAGDAVKSWHLIATRNRVPARYLERHEAAAKVLRELRRELVADGQRRTA